MNTREITDHKVAGDLNEGLTIQVLDEPGQGNANHLYEISFREQKMGARRLVIVPFQNGPIKEHGVNGVSNEALLAIVKDRLRGFQAGAFACDDNATALHHTEMALKTLQIRTLQRIERGVEGTNQA